jgi:hypothetical protein
MSALPGESRVFLDKAADVANEEINVAVQILVKSLEQYGFRGNIRLQLTVTVCEGEGNTVVERSSIVPYSTWR